MEFITIGGILILIAITVFLGHKIIRVHMATYQLANELYVLKDTALLNHYRQIQALLDLRELLDLKGPLPPTRGWAASPDVLLYLYRVCCEKKPEIIVECGSGVSTIVQAKALERLGRGHIYSLESDSAYALVTTNYLKQLGLDKYATVLSASLHDYSMPKGEFRWYNLSQLPSSKIDLVFIDGPPSDVGPLARYPALPLLMDRLACPSVLILDDADRPDEKEIIKIWQEDFPGLVVLSYEPCEKGCAILRFDGQ